MSEPIPPMPEPKNNRWIYWTLGAILVVLAVIGLITYSGEKKDQESQQKAAELTAKFQAAGLPVPHDQDIFIRTLGDDGGPVEEPGLQVRLDHYCQALAASGSFSLCGFSDSPMSRPAPRWPCEMPSMQARLIRSQ